MALDWNDSFTMDDMPSSAPSTSILGDVSMQAVRDFSLEDASGSIYGELGQYHEPGESSSTFFSGGSYGYASSSGGSNYKPKIYSSPRNFTADKATTMYAKSPQSANRSYINPSVSTKGSREAYKRQDI